MAIIKVTRKDVMASSLVSPDWYLVVVKSVITSPAAKDQSTNYVVSFQFVQEEYKDYFIKKQYLNEKGIFGTGLNLLVACGLPKEVLDKIRAKEMEDVAINTDDMEGKVIKAKISNTTWEGKVSNEAVDFLPAE
jgi:hypothetical protein